MVKLLLHTHNEHTTNWMKKLDLSDT